MQVLMLGWEFPPHKSGGLGTACYHMAKALSQKGIEILFIQPQSVKEDKDLGITGVKVKGASGVPISHEHALILNSFVSELWENNFKVTRINSPLHPYLTCEEYAESLGRKDYVWRLPHGEEKNASPGSFIIEGGYGPDLLEEVYRYSHAVLSLALNETFDVVHAHDWMAFPAGILVSRIMNKPLIVHSHALESDRSGALVNHEIMRIEKAGFDSADKIIAVSQYTKSKIINEYMISSEKILVAHNAVSKKEATVTYAVPGLVAHEKRVLFMGRVTFQKGPDYFVEAARIVLDRMPKTRFIMSGSGDMLKRMIRRVAELRIGRRFHFTGFLHDAEVERIFSLSDLYVMPSVSEPFGISPLEAMVFDTPVIISKQSGVSEIIHNALLVNFWDIEELAEKICMVLSRPNLALEMVRNSHKDLETITWDNTANSILKAYRSVCQ